jgi:HSP20 family protein
MSNLQKTTEQQLETNPIAQLFDQLLNLRLNPVSSSTAFNPAVDVIEHESKFEIQVSVPGARKEDFNIEIQKNNLLVISGSRHVEQKTEGKTWHRVETHYGSFTRTFTLPEHAKIDEIYAQYVDGILHVNIPKDMQKINSSKIPVK